MTAHQRILPEKAKELLDEGYVYLDVRSEPEFEAGHVPGALNVPWMQQGPGGLVPNPDFLKVMLSAFGKDERLLVGCRSGARSLKASEALLAAGFTQIVELATGWEGSRNAFGQLEPGWSRKGFPIETGRPEGQAYEDVRQRAPK